MPAPRTRKQVDPTLHAELEQTAAFRSELRRFLARTEAVTADAGLTVQRYDLLLMIKAAPGGLERSTVGELAKALQLRQTAVTELVKRTEEAGLIRRQQSSEDGRVWLLRLTAEGERRLMRAFSNLREEREALTHSFRRVDRHFRAATAAR
jgi:DNA-binding MarR family transcriptional regulator